MPVRAHRALSPPFAFITDEVRERWGSFLLLQSRGHVGSPRGKKKNADPKKKEEENLGLTLLQLCTWGMYQ